MTNKQRWWEKKLMDKFCVMFERATRDNDNTDWVVLLEAFIREVEDKAVAEHYKDLGETMRALKVDNLPKLEEK